MQWQIITYATKERYVQDMLFKLYSQHLKFIVLHSCLQEMIKRNQ